MRATRVIPLAGVMTMLAPYPSVEAQEHRLRAAMEAYAEARSTCTIVVLEATPTDERFVMRPPSDITPATRTIAPDCTPSKAIAPALPGEPRALAAPPTVTAPQFSLPAAQADGRPPHPLTEGLAGALKPR
ncbi:MAG TPA: hypothetical protein VMF13_20180 [Luteitalea sp.]|nr:hypothetical protein [Luteitalea sp.]